MAGVDLAEFIESVCLACDEYELVTSYDVRIQDNTTVKIRVFLETRSFIDVYFNPENGNCAFALVEGGIRIYGADNAFVGWHLHPFESPEEHQPCGEVSFGEFLRTVESWYRC